MLTCMHDHTTFRCTSSPVAAANCSLARWHQPRRCLSSSQRHPLPVEGAWTPARLLKLQFTHAHLNYYWSFVLSSCFISFMLCFSFFLFVLLFFFVPSIHPSIDPGGERGGGEGIHFYTTVRCTSWPVAEAGRLLANQHRSRRCVGEGSFKVRAQKLISWCRGWYPGWSPKKPHAIPFWGRFAAGCIG